MRNCKIYAYYGEGEGKTCLVIGRGVRGLSENLQVRMIQFLEKRTHNELKILKNFEPDFRIFRFSKENTDNSSKDIENEISQAFHFTKKIIDTGECDMLILDGFLDCISKGLLDIDNVKELFSKKHEHMEILLTGKEIPSDFKENIDYIYKLTEEN